MLTYDLTTCNWLLCLARKVPSPPQFRITRPQVRSNTILLQRLPLVLPVTSRCNLGSKPHSPFRIDTNEVEIEERVDIGPQQQTVPDAILPILSAGHDMSSFQSLNLRATRDRAPATISVDQRLAKLLLPTPFPDTLYNPVTISAKFRGFNRRSDLEPCRPFRFCLVQQRLLYSESAICRPMQAQRNAPQTESGRTGPSVAIRPAR